MAVLSLTLATLQLVQAIAPHDMSQSAIAPQDTHVAAQQMDTQGFTMTRLYFLITWQQQTNTRLCERTCDSATVSRVSHQHGAQSTWSYGRRDYLHVTAGTHCGRGPLTFHILIISSLALAGCWGRHGP